MRMTDVPQFLVGEPTRLEASRATREVRHVFSLFSLLTPVRTPVRHAPVRIPVSRDKRRRLLVFSRRLT